MFRALWENQLIGDSLRDQLGDPASFRNVIVHMYGRLDLGKVYERLRSDPGGIREFTKVVERLLREETGDDEREEDRLRKRVTVKAKGDVLVTHLELEHQ